jgi:hypothetical protein
MANHAVGQHSGTLTDETARNRFHKEALALP